ncbi:MAG: 50S ribosomal protein L21 [Anaerolineales bacterium]|nr:50S ribosomal protein L21 [Anaerolineales bacterium]
MRYAILESGGKQYVAREGETIEVDRLPLEIGKPVEFDQVLLAVNDGEVLVGDPLVKGAAVKAKVIDQIKAKKIIVFKYVPKQRYRRKAGHRQKYTRVLVDEISLPGAKKAAETKSTEDQPAAEKKLAKKKSAAKPTAEKSASKTSTKKSGESKAKKSAAAEKKSPSSPKKAPSKSTKKSSDS